MGLRELEMGLSEVGGAVCGVSEENLKMIIKSVHFSKKISWNYIINVVMLHFLLS